MYKDSYDISIIGIHYFDMISVGFPRRFVNNRGHVLKNVPILVGVYSCV